MNSDPLAPARGIVLGVIASAGVWAVILSMGVVYASVMWMLLAGMFLVF